MATANTIPDLDRRLMQDRSAVLRSVDALRLRMRHEVKELSPKRVLKRNAGTALAGAVVIAAGLGLAAGRMAGAILRSF